MVCLGSYMIYILWLFVLVTANSLNLPKPLHIAQTIRTLPGDDALISGISHSYINAPDKLNGEKFQEKRDTARSITVPYNSGPDKMKEVDASTCNLQPDIISTIHSYSGDVEKIVSFVLNGGFKGVTYDTLANLTDTFGARMTGSPQLEYAIDWTIQQFKNEEITNVYTEDVIVPHWIRNKESLTLLSPRSESLSILGLGSSVGTDGITAEVLVVESFDELKRNFHKAKGRIVAFNPGWTSYGGIIAYRAKGASEAAKFGAVAVLVRSIAPFSINSPHTGWQQYEGSVHKIPVACITVEDADMLQRYQNKGETLIAHLKMGAVNLSPFISRNTIAEIPGNEIPNEVVVVSGHLDSWDVGVGAMDDGGGSMISWSVPIIIQKLGLHPRRTIRTVLFTGEEQGLLGGQAYFDRHHNSKEKFQLLLESDMGTFTPEGISFSGSQEATCIMVEVLSLLKALNVTKIYSPMNGGPDIEVWKRAGFNTGSLVSDSERYFWFHHSEGDTMTVEDSETLDVCTALWTALAYVVADMNIELPL